MELKRMEELELAVYLNKIENLLKKHTEGFDNAVVSLAIGQIVLRYNTLSIKYEA